MFNKKFNLLKEATEYGFMPYMETYILDGKKRPIVVIFPGGGYGMVSEREAERIAMAYNAAGFCASQAGINFDTVATTHMITATHIVVKSYKNT